MNDTDPAIVISFCTVAVIGVAIAVIRAWFKGRKDRAAQAAAQAAAPQARFGSAADESIDLEKYAEHHHPHWSPNAARLGEDPVDWAMLIGAPFALCRGDFNDVLLFQDAGFERKILSEAWGVSDRASLLRSMFNLHASGHRTVYQHEIRSWSAMDQEQAQRQEQSMKHSPEALWRLRRVRANDRNINAVDFLAWDYIRFAMLARSGATAGYISQAEAIDFLLMIAQDIKAHYSSWAELGEHFHAGRWYWNSQGGEGEADLLAHDISRQHVLLGDNGPWSFLAWNIDTPPSRLLFADAVFEAGVRTVEFPPAHAPEASVQAVYERLAELTARQG